jgi:hypothetical protein
MLMQQTLNDAETESNSFALILILSLFVYFTGECCANGSCIALAAGWETSDDYFRVYSH